MSNTATQNSPGLRAGWGRYDNMGGKVNDIEEGSKEGSEGGRE